MAGTLLAGASVFLHAYLTMELPAPEDLTIPDPRVVYASNGQRVSTLDPTAIRRNVDVEQLPDRVWQAVLAAEDRGLQRVALDTLNAHLEGTAYTGAIVTIDPRNGAARALIGGRGFPEEQFSHATRGGNQAGSAFKPFALTAFVAAGNSPTRSVFAAPATMTVDFDRYADYRVSSFGRRGFGAQSVYEATLTSTNVVYAQLTSEVGPAAVGEVAPSLGIADDEDLRRATAPAIALVANLLVADFPDPDLAVLSPVAPQTVPNRAAVAR